MSEQANFHENEPVMHLDFGDGEVLDIGWDGASLYNYDEHLMEFDHIEISIGENEEGQERILCMFRGHDRYEEIADFMATHAFPFFINLRSVEDYVLDAYIDWRQRNDETVEPVDVPGDPSPPASESYGQEGLSPQELEALTTVKTAYDAEQARLAGLPMDERSICLRALEAAREEWMPWHERDLRADHMAREPRLMAAELLKPIDKLLDQLYKIDHPEEG